MKKIFISLFLVSLFISCSLEENFVKNKTAISLQDIKTKQINYSDFSRKTQYVKNKPDISPMISENQMARLAADTSDYVIYSDRIIETIFNDYTSYTMLLKTPNTTKNVYYNIVLEVRNNTTEVLILKYTKTESGVLEETITAFRSPVDDTPPSGGSIELKEFIDGFDNLGGGGSGGTSTSGSGGMPWTGLGGSPIYPSNCNGTVTTTYVLEPKFCASQQHLPGQTCEYLNPNYPQYNPSNGPYYELVPYYSCVPNPSSGTTNPPTSGGGNIGGGGNSPDPVEDTSITAMIQPVECTGQLEGDLDGDCKLSTYESCLLYISVHFVASLTDVQKAWWNNKANSSIKSQIENYIFDNGCGNTGSQQFAQEIIEQMRLNPELKLDISASAKSPANIDISLVQGTSEAEKKFRCIYEKLTQSPSFKNLFTDTFGTSNRINVKFEIVENLTFTNPDGSISYPNATCQMSSVNNNYNNTIKISTNILEGQRSNIEIAKTILHECIHAYLNIKKINCNNGTTIPQINNKLFPELLSSFYQDNCFIDVNGVNQGEHTFMFDYMIPVFQQVLGEVKNLIIPQSHIQIAEEGEYVNNLGSNLTWDWNDFYKYLSVNGLTNTQSFIDEIESNPNKLYLFNFYNIKANQFSKTCN